MKRRDSRRDPAEIISDTRARAAERGVEAWTATTQAGEEMLIHPVTGRALPPTAETGNGVTEWLISTDQVDRMNDRVDPNGVNIKRFADNPVILWCHDSWSPPIGRAAALPKVVSVSKGVSGLLMPLEFHRRTPLSVEVADLVDAGYIHAGSIGFIPHSYTIESSDKYEDARHDGWWEEVRTYDAWELLEFSICSVPMNPGALIQRDVTAFMRGAIERSLIPREGALAEWARSVTGERIELPMIGRADTPTDAPANTPVDTPADAPEPTTDQGAEMTEESYLRDVVALLQVIGAMSQLAPTVTEREDVTAFAAELVGMSQERIAGAIALLKTEPPQDTPDTTDPAQPEPPLPGASGATLTDYRKAIADAAVASRRLRVAIEKAGRVISKKNRELINTAHDALVLLKAAADDGVIDEEESEEIEAVLDESTTYGGSVDLSATITITPSLHDMTISEVVSIAFKAVADGKTESEACALISEKINVAPKSESVTPVDAPALTVDGVDMKATVEALAATVAALAADVKSLAPAAEPEPETTPLADVKSLFGID